MTDQKAVIDVVVTRFAYGGDLIGRLPDGRAVFVPMALPGEKVRLELIEEKPRFARARLLEVLEPSPDRIQPRCVHFGECGGCHYQHIPYERQLDAKREVVRDQLQRIAGIEDPPVAATVPSPNPFYYRNNVQFHQAPDGRLGYMKLYANDEVLPIRECHLPEPLLNDIWPQLEIDRQVGIERIGLRQGSEDEALLIIQTQDAGLPEMELNLPLSVVHRSGEDTVVLAGSDDLWLEVRGRMFRVSAGSFFQVNLPVAEAMVEHLLRILPLTEQTTLLDVYCGVGLFSAFLAPKVQRLVGVELAESATEDFAINLDEYENVELYEGAAEEILPHMNVPADVVLVDPPRAGLERPALDAIVALQPETIAYVSCDPATLARDLKRLIAAGYKVNQVTPFDMFPQTYHVETVCLMSEVNK